MEHDKDEAKHASSPAEEPGGHSAEHGHTAGNGHGDELAHTTPVALLVSVFAALIALTIATVAVTGVDLGGQGNLMIALIIATIKGGLVVTYFMHLRWDRKLHALVFSSALLFVILFLAMTLTDRQEYQPFIDQLNAAQAATP